MKRCDWVPDADPEYVAYHDEEWGVPSHDDRHLFEMLMLEGAQAGLSWSTILDKRDGYAARSPASIPGRSRAFAAGEGRRLLADPGIVRNRLKVESTVENARRRSRPDELGASTRYLWSFVDGEPIVNRWKELGESRPRPPSRRR